MSIPHYTVSNHVFSTSNTFIKYCTYTYCNLLGFQDPRPKGRSLTPSSHSGIPTPNRFIISGLWYFNSPFTNQPNQTDSFANSANSSTPIILSWTIQPRTKSNFQFFNFQLPTQVSTVVSVPQNTYYCRYCGLGDDGVFAPPPRIIHQSPSSIILWNDRSIDPVRRDRVLGTRLYCPFLSERSKSRRFHSFAIRGFRVGGGLNFSMVSTLYTVVRVTLSYPSSSCAVQQ